MTERMPGGQAVIRTLARFGIDTVFGLPGIQLDPLFDALHGQRQTMRTYHTRHEQGAAYMALGYAQASGRVGVFAVVPGPGILNATAGRWWSSTPWRGSYGRSCPWMGFSLPM